MILISLSTYSKMLLNISVSVSCCFSLVGWVLGWIILFMSKYKLSTWGFEWSDCKIPIKLIWIASWFIDSSYPNSSPWASIMILGYRSVSHLKTVTLILLLIIKGDFKLNTSSALGLSWTTKYLLNQQNIKFRNVYIIKQKTENAKD